MEENGNKSVDQLDHSEETHQTHEDNDRRIPQSNHDIPPGPPPIYSFLNHNEQEIAASTTGVYNQQPSSMLSPEEDLSGLEPPPPYPFVNQEQIPTIQNQAQQEDYASLVDLIGSCKEFSLKSNAMPCCPDFTITPLNSTIGLSIPETHNKIHFTSSGKGCYSCCLPSSLSWQTMSFLKNETEKLNFIYKSKAWFGACGKDRIVDIYIPERAERIGWIKFNGDFSEGAVIYNAISNEIFSSRKIELDQSSLALTMVNAVGLPVAIAQATAGVRYRGHTTWNSFKLSISPVTVGQSRDTKAMLLVAFTIWVMTYKENNMRTRFWFFIFFIALGLALGFGLPYILY